MSLSFVNLHGQPVSLANLMDAAALERRRKREAGIAVGRKPTAKNGYAAQPGTGPEGETCKTCVHKHSASTASGSKHFIKCNLRRATWTHGEGTDILARSPACSKFEKATKP